MSPQGLDTLTAGIACSRLWDVHTRLDAVPNRRGMTGRHQITKRAVRTRAEASSRMTVARQCGAPLDHLILFEGWVVFHVCAAAEGCARSVPFTTSTGGIRRAWDHH